MSALPILPTTAAGAELVDPAEADRKLRSLTEYLCALATNGIVIAFSGGVDSAFLLWAAVRSGVPRDRLLAVTAVSPSVPQYDIDDARALAEDLGVRHVVVKTNEVSDVRYRRNDGNRCFYCKEELFRVLEELGSSWNLSVLVYGYNHSDRGDVRPGHRAAEEKGVRAPLDDVGLTKSEIRFLLDRAGIHISSKPASPCLASRIGTGIEVNEKRLEDVEALESILRAAGARVVRVRVSGTPGNEFLRVEVAVSEIARVIEVRSVLAEEGRQRGYRWTVLDLAGYRVGGAHQ